MTDFALMRFGELAPDQPEFSTPTLRVARNVIPRASSYQPFPAAQDYSANALDSRCLGANAFRDRAQSVYNYAGTAGKLYRLVGPTWTDSTRTVGGDYAAARWEFVQFGQEVLALSRGNDLQRIAFGGTNFADLGASAGLIRAAHGAVVKQGYVLVGNLDDASEGLVPQRVRWNANGDIEDWDNASTSNDADQQDLLGDGGAVTRVVPGEFGLIFQERSIWRATFVGPPLTFQFDEVEPRIGTEISGSVVRFGYDVYFLAEDGFRLFRGASSTPIGEERIDRTVLRDLDRNHLDRVTSVIDTDDGVVWWAYPGPGNSGGTPNRLAMFNPNVPGGRWASGDEAVECLYRAATAVIDVDDAALNAQYANTDLVPGNVDDAVWQGGLYQVGALTPAHKLAFFTGPARDAELETSETQLRPGHRAFVSGIRPVVDGGATTLSVAVRNSQADDPVETAFVAPGPTGWAPFRVDGRYVRVTARISGDFADAVGVVPHGRVSGRR